MRNRETRISVRIGVACLTLAGIISAVDTVRNPLPRTAIPSQATPVPAALHRQVEGTQVHTQPVARPTPDIKMIREVLEVLKQEMIERRNEKTTVPDTLESNQDIDNFHDEGIIFSLDDE